MTRPEAFGIVLDLARLGFDGIETTMDEDNQYRCRAALDMVEAAAVAPSERKEPL
jgi:hypothetical protein